MDVDILNGRMRSLLETQAALSLGNAECLNCKLLTMKIKILEARLAMERHPKHHACQSAAILHALLNEMENLRQLISSDVALTANLDDLEYTRLSRAGPSTEVSCIPTYHVDDDEFIDDDDEYNVVHVLGSDSEDDDSD
ncbi:hypothetical protein Tco_1171411 [Tanacetum coccineum]|uniref:Uncharacterized protein n=1 Tax=Tanacetum coccineum TaxID=301880 RepID=A0ABQ5F094_9ASTR